MNDSSIEQLVNDLRALAERTEHYGDRKTLLQAAGVLRWADNQLEQSKPSVIARGMKAVALLNK